MFKPQQWLAVLVVTATLFITGCEGDDGRNGAAGQNGLDGIDGMDGQDGIDLTNPAVFKLQLLHFADVDGPGGADDVRNFSALVNGFRREFPSNTLLLSSGDNWIPGPEYFAAEDASLAPVLGVPNVGRAHVAWLNALGVQASALGNHELDQGAASFASIIAADGSWPGAQFPYLSTNVDGAGVSALAALTVADGGTAMPNTYTGSVVITIDGERIGIVGATTPTLASITSAGGLVITPDTGSNVDLAAEIQTAVDALTATGVNKVILLAHMQQIAVERALAGLLRDVDIIVAGGSNTILADLSDRLRGSDVAIDTYPLQLSSAGGEPVMVVNTNGDFTYLGRLVVDFDADGVLLPDSIDSIDSGAFGSDNLPNRSFDVNPEVAAITDALEAVLVARDGNVQGLAKVFLEGRRAQVRSEETNLGNLTADANYWLGRMADPEVVISLKNGGGIRAEIGRVLAPPGSSNAADIQLLPNAANASSGKPEFGVSQLDIQTALRFNNSLSLVSVTAAELADIIEHTVSGANPGATPGSFPQVAGLRFSFDPSRTARVLNGSSDDTNRADPAISGDRLRNLALVDDSGAVIDQIVVDGAVVGDSTRSFRMIALSFSIACANSASSCGDNYPFRGLANPNVVSLTDLGTDPGLSDFSAPGREQDALGEYLMRFFASVPFDQAETPALNDLRIQNLGVAGKTDTVFALPTTPKLTQLSTFSTPGAAFDDGSAEIVAFDPATDRLFVINAGAGLVDVWNLANPANPVFVRSLDPVNDDAAVNLDGVNSVAVGGGLVATALEADPPTANGRVGFYNASTLAYLGSIEAGALPDSLSFSPDGRLVLVANEGEAPASAADSDVRDFALDMPGSITLIDLGNGLGGAVVTQLGFADFNAGGARNSELPADIRINPNAQSIAHDIEPEFISIEPDGDLAFVSLQENNAIAVIDLAARRIDQIISLGLKDHGLADNAFDASDRDDAINIRRWPGVFGLYQPDGITSFNVGDESFVLTANEGDTRDDSDECDIDDFAPLNPVIFSQANLDANQNLGRLDLSCFESSSSQLVAFGGRSFSVVGSDGVIADSGDDFERITAHIDRFGAPGFPADFSFNANNSDGADSQDSRSDAKGPEPEGVVVGEVNGRQLAFIGLERVGGIMVYDVTNPRLPRFLDYFNNRLFDFAEDNLENGSRALNSVGDLGPEGLVFISAAQSPSGQALLVVGNEVTGTTTVYQIIP